MSEVENLNPFGAKYGIHFWLTDKYFIGNTDTWAWPWRTMFLGKSVPGGYVVVWQRRNAGGRA